MKGKDVICLIVLIAFVAFGLGYFLRFHQDTKMRDRTCPALLQSEGAFWAVDKLCWRYK